VSAMKKAVKKTAMKKAAPSKAIGNLPGCGK
jgi:hypothetical protein